MNLLINNFRAFHNEEFCFDKINILIGENSGGKSSLLKFLILLNQSFSFSQQDVNKRSNLFFSGEFIDLGTYKDVVYYGEDDRSIEFKFIINHYDKYNEFYKNNILAIFGDDDIANFSKVITDYVEKIDDEITVAVKITKDIELLSELELVISSPKIGKIKVVSVEDSKKDDFSGLDISSFLKGRIEFDDDSGHTECDAKISPEGFFRFARVESVRNFCDLKYPAEAKSIIKYVKVSYLLFAQNFISNYIKEIRYVNPIFSAPQRFYYDGEPEKSPFLTNHMLIRIVNSIPDEGIRKILIDRLNSALNEMGLVDRYKIERKKGFPISIIKVKKNKLWVNISDIGCGVSMQIPIIAEAIISELNGGRTILLEQPEIHLHPRLQANLIETLIKYGSKNKYIVETHSEHILRKLQVLVKKKFEGITNNNIKIYYFSRNDQKFDVKTHFIAENGRIQPNFPSGFFDSSYLLAKELL